MRFLTVSSALGQVLIRFRPTFQRFLRFRASA
jgi:hypothetical protein